MSRRRRRASRINFALYSLFSHRNGANRSVRPVPPYILRFAIPKKHGILSITLNFGGRFHEYCRDGRGVCRYQGLSPLFLHPRRAQRGPRRAGARRREPQHRRGHRERRAAPDVREPCRQHERGRGHRQKAPESQGRHALHPHNARRHGHVACDLRQHGRRDRVDLQAPRPEPHCRHSRRAGR